jgi:ABC-type nitrate/sulfonate/bicarbonate transport system substrate-binding protein
MRGIVQPTAGPNAWMNDLNSGNMDFGLLSATDSAWAYTGGPGFDKPAENFRLVLQGNFVYNSGFGVKADGSINSIKDLKGKKVASDYGGNIFTNQLAVASLAAAGLTWNDVAQVPVPQINSGLDLLQNGTVHATQAASPDTPKTLEVDSAIGGIKLLNFGDVKPEDIENGIPEDVQAIIDKEIPGVTLKVAPAAFQPGFGSRSIMPPLFMNLDK